VSATQAVKRATEIVHHENLVAHEAGHATAAILLGLHVRRVGATLDF
jgi:hypothetical protein